MNGRVTADHYAIANELSQAALERLEQFTSGQGGIGVALVPEDIERIGGVRELLSHELIFLEGDALALLGRSTTDGVRVLCAAYALGRFSESSLVLV